MVRYGATQFISIKRVVRYGTLRQAAVEKIFRSSRGFWATAQFIIQEKASLELFVSVQYGMAWFRWF